MPLQIGLWTINVNGNVGQLQINAIDASGNLSGSINVWGLGSIFGYWDEISQEISFSFVGGSGASPDTATFIGYLFTDNQTRMRDIRGSGVHLGGYVPGKHGVWRLNEEACLRLVRPNRG